MAKYRKKPVVIEAVHARALIHASGHDWKALPSWMREAYEKGGIVFTHDAIYIKTLEGEMKAEKSDMVICGVKGEVYPCKPDIFEETYEYESS